MEVGERISVLASFGPQYVVKPLRFRWGGRLLDVGEVPPVGWQTPSVRCPPADYVRCATAVGVKHLRA